MPDLRQLRTFIAVAETLNFTRAAERLSVGQQAVSKTIGQLEAELGVELVERTTREVGLTKAGRELLEAGRPALEAVDGAFASAIEVGHGLTGRVLLGHSPAIAASEVQAAIEALRSRSPELAISVHQVRPGEVEARLLAGELDLVLARTAGSSTKLDTANLRPTKAVLCVPEGHRFAERTWLSVAELDGERLLTYNPPGTPYTDLILTMLSNAGATVEPVEASVMGTPGQTSLVDLSENRTVALIPAGEQLPPGVVGIPFRESFSLPLLVAWPAGRPSPATERLREVLSSPG